MYYHSQRFGTQHQSQLYVIDYNRKNFLYVSSNPFFLCGHSPEEVQQKGYAFYFEVVPSDEISRHMEINGGGFRFYYDQSVEKDLPCPSSITFISKKP